MFGMEIPLGVDKRVTVVAGCLPVTTRQPGHSPRGRYKADVSVFQEYGIFHLTSISPEKQMCGLCSGIFFTPARLG